MKQVSNRVGALVLACVVAIVGLEVLALRHGINGTALAAAVAALGAIAGYLIRLATVRIKNRDP